MFHQKQRGSYCRCHALNNLVGRELITLKEFDSYCEKFDKSNLFVSGSSRNGHLFYNNGGTDNIFGYILKEKGINTKMVHYDFYRNKKIDDSAGNIIGYIIYNHGHTYCVKIDNREKWIIDSMKPSPRKVGSMKHFERRGIGVICVMGE